MLDRADSAALLTVEEVAARLHVHPKTVYRLLESGDLRGVKVGRVWRVSAGELARVAGSPAVARPDPAFLWAGFFERASFGGVVSDPATETILIANPAFAVLHGYHPAEIAGLSVEQLVAPTFRATLRAHLRQIDDRGHHVFQAIRIRQDGSEFPALVDAIAVKDGGGTAQYHVACVVDISAIKDAEAALREPRMARQGGGDERRGHPDLRCRRPLRARQRRGGADLRPPAGDVHRRTLRRAADLPHIFAAFRRAGNVDSSVPGLGLGFYISHEIVRAHGGTLSAVFASGEGSTFVVALPWLRAEA